MSDLELWYTAPAGAWTEALPIGNGRLGAMVFGGVRRERLQLNEDTLWTGSPYSQANPDAQVHLRDVRSLIFDHRYAEAEELADRHLMGRPLKQMSFQPLADLWIEQEIADEVVGYRRSLDIGTALATTRFMAGGIEFEREVFATAVDGLIVLRLGASEPQSLSFVLALSSEQEDVTLSPDTSGILLRGRNRNAEGVPGGLSFSARALVRLSGGRVDPAARGLQVTGADDVVILVDAATSFQSFRNVGGHPHAAIDRRLTSAARKSWTDLRAAHIAEHQRLFGRLSIELEGTSRDELPTNQRIAANAREADPGLAALYVQFARYLMISCSRPGTQAANLQGIWNDKIEPPWGSKYTANINLQMNYWLPDPANLGECMEPLIRLVEDVSQTGREIATVHYGARGWVLHHNTDLWRAAGPIDGAQWGLWPMGGAWLCVQLWDHAVFGGRPAELVRRIYPLIAGAVRFVLDILVTLPGTEFLVTSPSVSPENHHPHGSSLCAGPAMDRQIIRDLIDAFEAAAAQLNIDNALVEEARRARQRLPSDRVGGAGQLQEWLDDWDMAAPEIHHRHVSHLYGLYPSQQIHPDRTPGLTQAAQRSLEIRGDDATGWGIGWRINLWARLRDGDHAHGLVQRLLSPDRTYPNMFDAHPPFQIDGNFGGAAGILEMLVQSDEESVHLLPALPRAWPDGRLHGVRCRGALTVDLDWRNSQLSSCTIVSERDRQLMVRSGQTSVMAELVAGQPWAYPASVPGEAAISG